MEFGISILALIVAAGSLYYGREQVKLAKKTKSETEELLKSIDAKVQELKSLTGTIKQNVEDTIREMISNSNENFVKLLDKLPQTTAGQPTASGNAIDEQKERSSEDKLMEALLPGILEKAMDDPDSFDKFMEKMEKFGKK